MKLIIEDDEGRKTVVPIVRDEISIGRQEGNTIRLTERNVSRRHARLLKQNGAIYVEDLGSYNGVLVNGEKIAARAPVKEGDLIEIGDYDLAIEGAPNQADADTNPTGPNAPADRNKTPPMAVAPPPPRAPAGGATVRKDANATAVIRLSDLSRADAAAEERDLSAGEQPKLVGLSGQFRGREFALRRSVVKFGRTDDGNDIVIDHQSISRSHGRFQLEGSAWKLYDNKSANGVRVNGEEYGMASVGPGDTIELGHVKFRFCAPGETFVPSREAAANVHASHAEVLPSQTPVKKRTGLAIGLAVGGLVVVGAGAAVFLKGSTPKPGGPEDLCNKAKEAMVHERWSDVVQSLQVVKNLGEKCGSIPNLDGALAQARLEVEARAALEEAKGFADTAKWKQAVTALKAVPAESSVAAEAKLKGIEYRQQAVKSLEEDANRAIERGKLDDAKAFVDDIETIDDRAPAIDTLRKAIQERRAKLATVQQPAAPAAQAPTPATKSLAERNANATKLLGEGVQLAQTQNYQGAIQKLLACVAENPEASVKGKCYRNLGVSYARAKDNPKAIDSYKKYLQLVPDAPERAQLETMIKQYESR